MAPPEDLALTALVAATLTELQAERDRLRELIDLARRVDKKARETAEESKFQRLWGFLQDPRFRNEKALIFTEHRDTLEYLVRRLEGRGLAGHVAAIHGGMGTLPDPETGRSERERQIEFFRQPHTTGGARIMVATDAAGEGVNLQFCWLMVNYDVPWNPARLEQRMGRIHERSILAAAEREP